MQTNVISIVTNSYPSQSIYNARSFFKININKFPMRKKKSVKNGLALFAE